MCKSSLARLQPAIHWEELFFHTSDAVYVVCSVASARTTTGLNKKPYRKFMFSRKAKQLAASRYSLATKIPHQTRMCCADATKTTLSSPQIVFACFQPRISAPLATIVQRAVKTPRLHRSSGPLSLTLGGLGQI